MLLWARRLVICLLTVCCSAFSIAAPPEQLPDDLAALGLKDLEILSEQQATDVRGLGGGSSGTSILIGSLIDPSTGSTANFFQVQSSGAIGANAFHSNLIDASFGWVVGGIAQRFQAEIGGFGFGFAR